MKAKGKRLQYQISGTLLSEILFNLFPPRISRGDVTESFRRRLLASKFVFPAPYPASPTRALFLAILASAKSISISDEDVDAAASALA